MIANIVYMLIWLVIICAVFVVAGLLADYTRVPDIIAAVFGFDLDAAAEEDNNAN